MSKSVHVRVTAESAFKGQQGHTVPGARTGNANLVAVHLDAEPGVEWLGFGWHELDVVQDQWQELLEAANDVIADVQPGAYTPALDRLFNALELVDPS